MEKRIWLILEWSAVVVDIREQFPLFPRQACWQLANDLDINHPYDNSTGVPYVLTTDFLLTLGDPDRSLLALSAKYESELAEADASMLAKQELERRFWEHFGVPWRLVTDSDVPHPLVENLEWLIDCETLPKKLSQATGRFAETLARIGTTNDTLQAVANKAATGLSISEGDALSILCHLIWRREIAVNLNEKLSPSTVQTIVPGVATHDHVKGFAR